MKHDCFSVGPVPMFLPWMVYDSIIFQCSTRIGLYAAHQLPVYRGCVWPVSPFTPIHESSQTTMFQKRRLTNSGAAGSNTDLNRCERIQRLSRNQLFNRLFESPAKRQRVADGAKILLDVAKESADWFPPLKSALGGVNALIKHYEVLVESATLAHN